MNKLTVIDNSVRKSLKGKDKVVVNKMFKTFEMINGNNLMLENSIMIWDRMYDKINHLSSYDQFNIIYETTMIAYDARISAFDHMDDFNKKLKNKSLDKINSDIKKLESESEDENLLDK